MTGLYIHVPFCKTRCAYCSFYSTTSQELMDGYLHAILREMDMQESQPLASVYLGGGTPSQLGEERLSALLGRVGERFTLLPDAEVTVEVNPDDVTPSLAQSLRACGVNRVSMGVQSFVDAELRAINRRHTAQQAREAISVLREAGITNLSIDLIYGLPGQTLESFAESVEQAVTLPVTHISSYALSIEEGTVLHKKLEAGEISEADEETSLQMYTLLRQRLHAAGYHHYEISNFARPGFEARHNASYWAGAPYLGLGPGAHGYDGRRLRRHNLDNLHAYIAAAQDATAAFPPCELEHLSDDDLHNELVFTRLRTDAGLLLTDLSEEQRNYILRMAAPHLRAGRLAEHEGRLRLTAAGLFVSDDIISDLMV